MLECFSLQGDCEVLYCLRHGDIFLAHFWSETEAGLQRLLQVLISLVSPCPQIEKIMTLIGAGIDFSRDQHYATPGMTTSSQPFHMIKQDTKCVASNSERNISQKIKFE